MQCHKCQHYQTLDSIGTCGECGVTNWDIVEVHRDRRPDEEIICGGGNVSFDPYTGHKEGSWPRVVCKSCDKKIDVFCARCGEEIFDEWLYFKPESPPESPWPTLIGRLVGTVIIICVAYLAISYFF